MGFVSRDKRGRTNGVEIGFPQAEKDFSLGRLSRQFIILCNWGTLRHCAREIRLYDVIVG